MADFEIRVDTSKYENRITMLQGHVASLNSLMEDYENIKQRLRKAMGTSDAAENAIAKVDDAKSRVQKAIDATQANITTLRNQISKFADSSVKIDEVIDAAGVLINTFG